MAIPQAPMPPPPPPFAPGRPPPGAIPINEWQGQPIVSGSPLDDPLFGPNDPYAEPIEVGGQPKPKKDKNKNKDKNFDERVETAYRGYVLEKAEPKLGQKATWARVGRRDLPVEETQLVAYIKTHRQKTRSSPITDFNNMSQNQRGIVNRMIAEHDLHDKNSNAKWMLADVQRFGTRQWGRIVEVKRMQVILKRQDKNDSKSGDKTSTDATTYYGFGEIIDLTEPLSAKKDKDKDKSKAKNKNKTHVQEYEDGYQPIEEIYEAQAPISPMYEHHQQQQQHYVHAEPHHGGHHQQPVQQQPWEQPWEQQAPMADPLANMAGPPPIQQQQQQHHHHPHQQPFDPQQNPFQPHPGVAMPGQFDEPHWQDNHHEPLRARVQTPAPDSQPKRSNSGRRLRNLETQNRRLAGEVDELRDRLENFPVSSGESSEGVHDRDSAFWSDPPTNGSRTPPSSVSPTEENYPRGDFLRQRSKRETERTRAEARAREQEQRREAERRAIRLRDEERDADRRLEQRRKDEQREAERRADQDAQRRADRDARYRLEQRERRYRDERVEVQPHTSYRPQQQQRREIRYSPERPRSHSRHPRDRSGLLYDTHYDYETQPQLRNPLRRSQTYDDYPRVAEQPRYVPQIHPPLQRRITDHAEAYPYAEYDDRARRRSDTTAGRRPGPVVDAMTEAFEAGRRTEEARYAHVQGRRRSPVEGGYFI